ncbi:kelch repeat and BTB domain-containing protein 11-like [Centroberyx gerrardi]|uniref:kelch repeat and BTB domain-containing protein 11-like n=1 Tax=Centroberyx gerrardi TaxID=166262 RepID=UPI003AAF8A58
MEVREDKVSEIITGDELSAPAMSQQISADNCYEILTKAKSQGAEDLKRRVYKYMSDNFLQILRNPGVYGRLTAGEREQILARRMEGRRLLSVAEINEVFDRVGSRESSRPQSPLSALPPEENRHRIFCFHEETKRWEVLTSMPEEIPTKGSGICTMYNYLFVAGGIKAQGERTKASDKVFCYNPLTGRWTEVRPLSQPRAQLKLVSMDGYLFAIGGECLFTVERYDPRLDRWSPVAPLPKGSFAVAHEATSCGGDLFVSGGSLFYRLLRYDSRRDEWEECPFNESRRRSTDMVAHRSLIYRFDVNREQGVNVFKYNTVVKVWHGGASFPLENPLPFRCAVLGDRIYCVNKSQTLQFVLEEDPDPDRDREGFLPEVLPAPAEARGALVPFVLSLDKTD